MSEVSREVEIFKQGEIIVGYKINQQFENRANIDIEVRSGELVGPSEKVHSSIIESTIFKEGMIGTNIKDLDNVSSNA